MEREFLIAREWALSWCILLALGEVKWYLRERCYRQLASPDRFVVPRPPPSVIELEGALGMGMVWEPIDLYLFPEVYYAKWWAT